MMKTKLFLALFLCTLSIAGCNRYVLHAPFFIPDMKQIKSMSEWSSSLPLSPHVTVTPKSGSKEINQVLGWLRKAGEIQPEHKQIGKGGYPPGIQLTLKNGETFVISPAINQSVKHLSGATEITGKNATGYIDYSSGTAKYNMPTYRIYAPALYQWLMTNWEKDVNLYPATVTLQKVEVRKNSLDFIFTPGLMPDRTIPRTHISAGKNRALVVVLHKTQAGKYPLNRAQPLHTDWGKSMVLRQSGSNLILTITLKTGVRSYQPEIDGDSTMKYTFQ